MTIPTSGEGVLYKCPVCDSDQISAETAEVEGEYAWQKVACNKCETKWTEDFKSVGWELNLNGKTGEEFN